MKFIVLRIKRRKKRNALDVVPVVVRNKNMRLRGSSLARRGAAVPQHAQTCAAIQNKLRAIRCNQLQARRVSAVAPCRRIHRRRGASHTPEAQLYTGSSHLSPRTGLAQLDLCAYACACAQEACSMLAAKPGSVNEFKVGKCQTA